LARNKCFEDPADKNHTARQLKASHEQLQANVKAAAAKLKKLTKVQPKLACVLGSGFQHVLTALEVEGSCGYGDLPGFSQTGVPGHAGKLYVGKLEGEPIVVLSGRAHFYEGHPMERVTFAIRALAAYGITDLLLTNAAGGINPKFRAGDFMAIEDHINLMGINPLRGKAPEGVPRFVDMGTAYDKALLALLVKAARKIGKVRMHTGVYLAVCGPSYETPAEIRAFRILAADAVGMSTVPEAIVARQCGIRVAGLSCITNLAAGRSKKPLNHEEVLKTGEEVKIVAAQLLKEFVKLYGSEPQK
jgi:purine-nucleoside phosphorylase